MRDEWTGLLAHAQRPNVFLSWEWMAAWLETQDRHGTPYVVLLRDTQSRALAGVAPLYRIVPRSPLSLRAMTFMGTGVGADHLAFVCRSGTEGQVYEGMIRHLVSAGAWDVLELPRMEEQHAAYAAEAISKWAGGAFACTVTLADLCPYIPLPSNWEEYLRLIGRNSRKNFGRRWRRLQEQGEVTFRRVESPSELERSWEVFIHLHQMRREAVGDRSAFLTPRSMAFHQRFLRAALDRGWLRFYLVLIAGRCVAVQYCLSFGRRTAVLQGGFDIDWSRYGVGMVLMAHAIQAAIEEGNSEFDFLRGAEMYKEQQWAAVPRRNVSLMAWRRHPRVRLIMAARERGRVLKERIRARRARVAASESPASGDPAAGIPESGDQE